MVQAREKLWEALKKAQKRRSRRAAAAGSPPSPPPHRDHSESHRSKPPRDRYASHRPAVANVCWARLVLSPTPAPCDSVVPSVTIGLGDRLADIPEAASPERHVKWELRSL